MQSTFPSTMADSMSGDELSKMHLGRQIALQDEKYQEPKPAVEEVYQTTTIDFLIFQGQRGGVCSNKGCFRRKTNLFWESGNLGYFPGKLRNFGDIEQRFILTH